MSKSNNLKDFLKDIADAIRYKKQSTAPINPQKFSDEIRSIKTTGTSTTIVQNYQTQFGNDIY